MVPSSIKADYDQPPSPTLLPRVSGGAEKSKHKFSKSRNGCITCKSRRVKCDETKPACNQCARRRIECGGYRIDVRFKVARASGMNSTRENDKRESPSLTSWSKVASRTTQSSRDDEGAGASGTNPRRLDEVYNVPGLPYYKDMIDLGFLDSGTSTSRSLPTSQSLGPLNIPDVALHTPYNLTIHSMQMYLCKGLPSYQLRSTRSHMHRIMGLYTGILTSSWRIT